MLKDRAWPATISADFTRLSGHQSSSSSVNGSVTTIGFDMSPRANSTTTSANRERAGVEAYRTYAQVASSQKSVLSTSFRSAIHATDSTCSGWMPNSAATHALRQRCPVIPPRSRKSTSVFTA